MRGTTVPAATIALALAILVPLLAGALAAKSYLTADGHPLPAGDSWSERASLAVARKGAAAAGQAGWFYLFGDAEMKGMVDAYDPAGDRWVTKKAMPQARWSPAAAGLGGAIYLFGGGDYPPTKAFAEVWRYDPAGDSWTPEAPMPTPRFQAAAVALGGKIYVIGGSDRTTWMDTVEVFEPGVGWSSAPAVGIGRAAAAAAVLDGKIYVTGGRDRQSNTFATVEVYDPASGWSPAPPMMTPRRGHGAAALDGKLYAFGGCNGALISVGDADTLCGRYLAENEEYDPATGKWSARAPLPGSAAYFGTASTSDAAFVFGGEGNVSGAETFRYEPPTLPVLDRTSVDPPFETLAPGESVVLSARALDAAGAEIGGASFSWSLTGTAGTISANSGPQTTFAAAAPGSAIVKVVASYQGRTADASADITVAPIPIARVTVEPGWYQLSPGGNGRMVASGFDATGNAVAAEFRWSVHDPGVATLNTTQGRFVEVTAIAPGKTSIIARATMGNSTREGTANVSVLPPADRFPPSVTVTSPSAGSRVAGAFTFRGTSTAGAGGPAVSRIDFRIDGGAWSAATGTADWMTEIDPGSLAWSPGAHALEARAFDGGEYSTIVKVKVDYRQDEAVGGNGSPFMGLTFPALALIAVAVGLALVVVAAARRSILSSRRGHLRR